MKQVQEFSVSTYETSLSVPDNARGVSVTYSPMNKNIVLCFECEAVTTYFKTRKFKRIPSWGDIPDNAKYCGSAIMVEEPQFAGSPTQTLWHVYELF